jgi:hypothetical protein
MDQVRRILHEPINQLVNDGIAADMVIVIQNKNEWLLDRLQYLVYQQVGRSFRKAKHLLVSFAQVWKDSFAECRIEILDALRYITEKDDWVCVGVVELVPNRRAHLAANKVSDQSGFAASGICRNHCYRRAEVGLQLRCEPRAPQKFANSTRRKQFCPEKKVSVLHRFDEACREGCIMPPRSDANRRARYSRGLDGLPVLMNGKSFETRPNVSA